MVGALEGGEAALDAEEVVFGAIPGGQGGVLGIVVLVFGLLRLLGFKNADQALWSYVVRDTFLIPVEQSVPVAGPRGKLRDHAPPRRIGQKPTAVVLPPDAADSTL